MRKEEIGHWSWSLLVVYIIIIIYSAFNLVFVTKNSGLGCARLLEDSLACLLRTSLISLTHLTR